MKLQIVIGCAVAMALFSSCSSTGRNELKSSSPLAAQVHAALNRTVIPSVDLENVRAADALKFWSESSRIYDRRHFKFQHVLSYPMVFENGKMTMTASPDRTPNVTVRRKNITSKQLLDEICSEAHLQWMIQGRVILVRPNTTPSAAQL
jgi:hypothetical protein